MSDQSDHDTEHRPRFSEGQEDDPDNPQNEQVGRFDEGQADDPEHELNVTPEDD